MESTRELRDQQKRRAGVSARIQRRGQEIATEEASVDRGGDPSKLVGLRHAQEFDRQSLAGMDAEVATLEGAAERERQIQRLVELDAIVETARAEVTTAREAANDALDTLLQQLTAKESALSAAETGFLQVAASLARIYSDHLEHRPACDALREELQARGAMLAAIGRTRHGHHAFTIGGGGDAEWPSPWGWLLAQGVGGVQRQRQAAAERVARSAATTEGAAA